MTNTLARPAAQAGGSNPALGALREMRTRAGLEQPEVAAQLTALLRAPGDKPISPQHFAVIEHRGTARYDYLDALAKIYRLPIEAVAAAARAVADARKAEDARKRKKNIPPCIKTP